MENVVLERPAPDRQGVALKAFARIADAWSLTLREAAALADMSDSTWKRAKKPAPIMQPCKGFDAVMRRFSRVSARYRRRASRRWRRR